MLYKDNKVHMHEGIVIKYLRGDVRPSAEVSVGQSWFCRWPWSPCTDSASVWLEPCAGSPNYSVSSAAALTPQITHTDAVGQRITKEVLSSPRRSDTGDSDVMGRLPAPPGFILWNVNLHSHWVEVVANGSFLFPVPFMIDSFSFRWKTESKCNVSYVLSKESGNTPCLNATINRSDLNTDEHSGPD